MTASRRQRDPWALGGVLFAAFFVASLVLGGVLATSPLPMPGAPATDVVLALGKQRTRRKAVRPSHGGNHA